MQHMISLMCAVEFIEKNVTEALRVADVSEAAFVSVSHLQRMFTNAFHCSIGDYIVKRRLCRAAHALLHSTRSVTELAFDYGYGSTESFSRAFKKQFRKSPTAFRRENRFSELYPKLLLREEPSKGWDHMIRWYDTAELGAKILAAKGTYIINVDVDGLLPINENMGHDTGDIVIAETAARIERSIGDGAVFFRIGGDQFAVLTGSVLLAEAERIAKGILSYADDEIAWKNGMLKFSLSLGICKIPEALDDAQAAIAQSDEALYEAKRKGRNTYVVQ